MKLFLFCCINESRAVLPVLKLILPDKTPRYQLKSKKKDTWTIKEFKSSSTVCTLPELFECRPIFSDHIWDIHTWQHITHICITHQYLQQHYISEVHQQSNINKFSHVWEKMQSCNWNNRWYFCDESKAQFMLTWASAEQVGQKQD